MNIGPTPSISFGMFAKSTPNQFTYAPFLLDANGALVTSGGTTGTQSNIFAFDGTTFSPVKISQNLGFGANQTIGGTLVSGAGTSAFMSPLGGSMVLLGYAISVAGTLAAAAPVLITIKEAVAGTTIGEHVAAVGTAIIAGGDTQLAVSLGNGYKAAVGHAITISINATFLTGGVGLTFYGHEE